MDEEVDKRETEVEASSSEAASDDLFFDAEDHLSPRSR